MTADRGPGQAQRRTGRPESRRVVALLRSPRGLRQVLLAKEILDPPVSLRGLPSESSDR